MPKKMRKAARRRRNPAGFICVCVLPALILTLFFTILPTIRACLLSFTNATALSLHDPKDYIGTVVSTKPVPSPTATGEGGLRR